MNDPLLHWRDEFPILQRCTYLISNSLGAMPRGAYDALRRYADEWATEGVTAWHHWLPEVGRSPIDRLIRPQRSRVVEPRARRRKPLMIIGSGPGKGVGRPSAMNCRSTNIPLGSLWSLPAGSNQTGPLEPRMR